MPFRVSVCGLSDIGCVRQKNEDVWDQIPEENFFVLADGMGGHRAGDVAARAAVKTLMSIVKSKFETFTRDKVSLQDIARMMRLAMEETNRTVYDLSKEVEDWRGMGTTLCCAHLQSDGLVFAHVGDSRVYRYRDMELEQLTDDHSLLREMIRLGQIKEQPRSDFAYKNIITKAIGTEPIVEPTVNISDLRHNDIILMCTDGLSDVLSLEEMQSILQQSATLHPIASALVSAAKARGGPDNVTVVLIKAQEVGEHPQ